MVPATTAGRLDEKESNRVSTATPEQVLETIVTGINSGDLDSLMPLYESEAAFATQPGTLAPGAPGVREALAGSGGAGVQAVPHGLSITKRHVPSV